MFIFKQSSGELSFYNLANLWMKNGGFDFNVFLKNKVTPVNPDAKIYTKLPQTSHNVFSFYLLELDLQWKHQ